VAEGRNELRVYVVRKGDNLHAIARRLGVPLRSLLTPNGLTPKSTIQPGQRLLVTQ
jgi:LysM repeat protein